MNQQFNKKKETHSRTKTCVNQKVQCCFATINIAMFTLFLSFFFFPKASFAQREIENFAIPNQCIIQVKNERNISEILNFLPQVILKERLSKGMSIYLLEKQNANFSKEEIIALSQTKNVIAAQFNHKVEKRSAIPDDTYFSQQWNMLNTGQLYGTPGTDINAIQAWEINTSPLTKDGDTMVVAVFDEYYPVTHEDLNFFVNKNEIPNNGIDDDGNGFIDDYYGWNAYNNTGDVIAGGSNHSTAISGIIGAYGNNDKGIAGVVWGAKILRIGASSVQESIAIKGYDYAIEMRKLWNQTNGAKGAFVIVGNTSYGVNNGKPEDFPIWCALYDTMGRLGILNVAATSNASVNVDDMGDIPTTCPSKWLISVTGHSAAGNRYGGYGLNNIDIAAPATNIFSSNIGNAYSAQSGTSFACPHVAGAILAMYAEACPKFMNDYFSFPDSMSLYVKDWLLSAATQEAAFNNKMTSDGRLDLYHSILNTHNYNCNNCNFSVEINTQDVKCKGENNGTISVYSTANNLSFEWNDGNTSRNRENLKPGLYQLTITDNNLCQSEAVAIIREPDTLIISYVDVVPPHNGTANIIVNTISGGDSLWYSLDGSNWQLNNIFTVSSIENYTVYVKNESGCVLTENIAMNNVNEVEATFPISLFPNPAKDILALSYFSENNKRKQLKIFDLARKLILEQSENTQRGFNKTQISIAALASGIYFLKIENSTQTLKFVVEK